MPKYNWVPRESTIQGDLPEYSVGRIPQWYPRLVTEMPEIAELCARRSDYILPHMTTAHGITDNDFEKTYASGVTLIQQSIDIKQPIVVALDYDCDGQAAGACMVYVLRRAGAEVYWTVPNRLEQGYGLNVDLIRKTISDNHLDKVLVVTVDNGITCVDEVKQLRDEGHMVLITDHHLQEGELPAADAIVNPKITMLESDAEYMVPGVYVAAKTALQAAKKYVDATTYAKLVDYCNQLVALGIVSDIIDLNELIRDQLLIGLSALHATNHAGIKCLFDICRVRDNQNITSNFLAFSVVPKLNAAGRMGAPEKGVELLLATGENENDNTTILLMANALKFLNSDRKIIEEKIYQEALTQIPELEAKYKNTLVLYHEGWHAGVLGIIAARIAEAYAKPTLVLTKTPREIEGSGRSVEGYDLFTSLQQCDTLTSFGGHMVAAGVHLTEDKIEAFREQFDKVVTETGLPTELKIEVDAEVTIPLLNDVRWQIFLETFEPHGPRNPELIFCLRKVEVYNIEPKRSTINVVLHDANGYLMQASKYHYPEEWLNYKGQLVDVLLSPNPLYFSTLTSMEYRLVDIRPYAPLTKDITV